jgi:hypothetical protein
MSDRNLWLSDTPLARPRPCRASSVVEKYSIVEGYISGSNPVPPQERHRDAGGPYHGDPDNSRKPQPSRECLGRRANRAAAPFPNQQHVSQARRMPGGRSANARQDARRTFVSCACAAGSNGARKSVSTHARPTGEACDASSTGIVSTAVLPCVVAMTARRPANGDTSCITTPPAQRPRPYTHRRSRPSSSPLYSARPCGQRRPGRKDEASGCRIMPARRRDVSGYR